MAALKVGSTTALTALLNALADPDGEVRHHAGEALRAAGSAATMVLPTLIESFDKDEPHVRRVAAHALKKIGPAAVKTVPALIEGLADPDAEIRRLAASPVALERHRGRDLRRPESCHRSGRGVVGSPAPQGTARPLFLPLAFARASRGASATPPSRAVPLSGIKRWRSPRDESPAPVRRRVAQAGVAPARPIPLP